MREKTRKRVFLFFGGIFLLLFCYSTVNLPPWGNYRGPYGDLISRVGVYERHATDIVNAVNYDYRAFDTLGEEFILFTAVLGVMMLLRRESGQNTRDTGKVEDSARLSTTVRTIALPAILLTIVFGFDIGLHGQLTPGGGFQGGVILASALFLLYVCENTESFRRITSHTAVETIEAIGAGSSAHALVSRLPPRSCGMHTFFGWGTEPITDEAADVSELPETASEDQRTFWYHYVPAAICVFVPVLLLVTPHWLAALRDASGAFTQQSAMLHLIYTGTPVAEHLPVWTEALFASSIRGTLAFLLAVLLACTSVFRSRLRRSLRIGAFLECGIRPLRLIQSGHPGDYVLWLTIGLACVSSAAIAILRA